MSEETLPPSPRALLDMARRDDAAGMAAACEGLPRMSYDLLVEAARSGSVETCKLLLSRGERRELEDETPLMAAASEGQTTVVKLLLAEGADPFLVNSAGRTALHLAAQYDHGECSECLIAAGADHKAVDHSGQTPESLAGPVAIKHMAKALAHMEAKALARCAAQAEKQGRRRI